jgi:hypothetical protein
MGKLLLSDLGATILLLGYEEITYYLRRDAEVEEK